MARTSPSSEARREDAREKIQLGGLIVKAGLRSEDRAFILGLLLDGVERAADPELKARMRHRGLKEFQE